MPSRLAVAAVVAAVCVGGLRPRPAGAGACRDDVIRLCPQTAVGSPEARACLEAHAAQLSPACRARRDGARAAAPQEAATGGGADRGQGPALRWCGAELHAYCGDVAAGDGRLRACLAAHADGLGAACRAALEARGR